MPNELDGSLTVGDLTLKVVFRPKSVIDGKHGETALNYRNVGLFRLPLEVTEYTVFEQPKLELFQREIVVFAIGRKSDTHYEYDVGSVWRFGLVLIH